MSGPPPADTARIAASKAVDRIDRGGAYSNVLVARTRVEPPADHGFYQRLVYSVLRHMPGIDRAIERAADRPIREVDPVTRGALRVSVAELRVLEREPYAAVNEGVETVKALGRSRAAGFVNAVLRSVAAHTPDVAAEPADSYPEALIHALVADMGQSEALAFLEASNEPAPIGVRERSTGGGAVGSARYLGADESLADVAASVDVIDPASLAVAGAVAAQPGDSVLDLAAAPGGKTRALAEAVGESGCVIAADKHARRLRDAARRSTDIPSVSWLIADAGSPPFRKHSFDRVLLDAPCSGLGTMRRRPEIRYRARPESWHEYGAMQRSILERAVELVRPGGRIVYSVCTVTSLETVEVVAGLGFSPPDVGLGQRHGEGLLLTPHRDGTDGMFIAVLDV